jgi:benzoate-CoA ligase family protein
VTSRLSAGKDADNASLAVDRSVEAGRGAKVACIASDATLTYEQLRLQVNRMGHVLRELGVRREQRVLLVLDDTSAFPIAFLGAIRIGAVPVPVSGRDTADNLRYFVEDSYAEVVVCDAANVPTLQQALEGCDIRYVVRGGAVDDAVDFDSALATQDGELSALARTHPDDMAFWLYSSGSTGMPKGVVHLHRNVEAICETFAKGVLDIREEDRIFATSKLHHAYALGNSLWFSLYFGATAVLLDGPPQPERLLSTLCQQRPTVLFSVPALYALLAGDPSADGALESVRLCVSASAPLPVQTFDRWLGRFGLEIVDGIGSTEMLSTFCSNRPGEVVPGTTGHAVPGYDLRLTDDSGGVLEGVAVGALEVRGDSCAASYWHQRERAKHSMRGEWFVTGDRYERRQDGNYVYVGRTDDMLKVGGLWVSPVDIELVLAKHPAVAEAGVVGVVVDDHTRIAAVIKCSEGVTGGDELAHALREWCKERMRDYEYPHIVRFVEELPRTLTGKPQRFKLRELVDQQVQRQDNSDRHRRLRDLVNDTLRRGKPVKSSGLPGGVDSRQSVAIRDHGDEIGGSEGIDSRKGVSDSEGVDGHEGTDYSVDIGDREDAGAEVKLAARALSLGLAGAPAHERARVAIELVCVETASVLDNGSAETVEPQRAFKELGFDSVAAVELRNRLSTATGLKLPSTLIFDHPTPAGLARHLCLLATGSEDSSQMVGGAQTHVDEPIAIIGMSCRYPGGVASPEELWRLVAAGVDAISEFPTERGWQLDRLYNPDPNNLGTSYVRAGGFLHDAAEFDAGFFGISPREAMTIDPQQRLLLEVAWEALEDAEIDPMCLRGTDTGVFAGVMYQDYGLALSLRSKSPDAEGYALLGSSGSVASGRIAYAFDLEGPAVTVDTACSSSLVALHLASQSLRAGECSLALAGGVTVMATPGPFLEYSRQRGLAVDGRCKSFAEAADGTGFSEGVGVVLLERLSDALLNGHSVSAVICGSAVNQDGASNGLTAPSGPSQERVIRQALANAHLSAEDVGVVEAHGTGTSLGDPIEAHALLATYGRDRDDERPLWLGSVKSNIGHTQAAAGMAGVIKMVKAFEHGLLPKTLHVDEPSRHVDWSTGGVRLLTEEVTWRGDDGPRRAAVSSFGVSGTNAHVILEESAWRDGALASTPTLEDRIEEGGVAEAVKPSVGRRVIDGCGVVPWILSGRGESALRAQAGRLHRFVTDSPEVGVGDVGVSLARRSMLESRAVILGGDRESLAAGVSAVESGQSAAHVISGATPITGGAGVVLVFPGQGSQWNGMAVRLLDESPVFAELMQECGDALSRYVDWSLDGVLRGHADMPGLGRIDVVQPALFAVMVSLAGLWRACGVEPAAVVGHSQGEIAAVHVSGGLSLDDAARVVALRSRLLARLAGEGGIVSVALPVADVMSRLAQWGGRIGLAGVNGPRSATVSGDGQALAEFVERCVADDVRARMVPDTVASHSARVDTLHDELCEMLAPIVPRTGDVPFYSTVSGGLLDTGELNAEYWFENMRQPVLFEQTTRTLLDDGFRVFIEASPHPVVTFGIQETVDEALGGSSDVVVGDSMRKGEDGVGRFLTGLGEVWVRGVNVDWGRVLAGSATKRVGLPSYAFQRKRFWLDAGAGVGDVTSIGLDVVDHPLLGAGVALGGGGGWLFAGRISREHDAWLSDRELKGHVLFPGTGLLDLVLHAARELGCAAVRDLALDVPLALPQRGGVQVQVLVGELEEGGMRAVSVFSCPQEKHGSLGVDRSWTRNAFGVLLAEVDEDRDDVGTFGGVWPPEGAVGIEIDDLYSRLADVGLDYGGAFQGLRGVWRCGEDLFFETSLPTEHHGGAVAFTVHPVLLDAALHAAVLTSGTGWSPDSDTSVEFSWGGVQLGVTCASSLKIRVSPVEGGRSGELSILAVDESGELVVSARSLLPSKIALERVRDVDGGARESLFHLEWAPVEPEAAGEGSGDDGHMWAVLGQEDLEIASDLERAGANFVVYPDIKALIGALDGGAELPAGVLVDVRALQVDGQGDSGESLNVIGQAHRLVHDALAVLRDWLADERLAGSRLVVLSREAVRVRPDDGVCGLPGAGVWGLLRSAQSENPGCVLLLDSANGGCVDDYLLRRALVSEEPQLAIRDGKLWAPRLTRVPATSHEGVTFGEDARSSSPVELVDGTVLITGGTGHLGKSVAQHLVVEHGVRSLVLASLHGIDAPGATALQEQLESCGAQIQIVACDVSDRNALEGLLGRMPIDLPLCGVVHAAGVYDDALIGSLSEENVERTLTVKVDAAWHLHELTRERELPMFVLFSSTAGTLGGVGQAGSAAASAFLDSLATYRRALGHSGISIAWSPWEHSDGVRPGIGSNNLKSIEQAGMSILSSKQGLEIFDLACALQEECVLAACVDLRVLRTQARTGVLPVLMNGLAGVPRRRGGQHGWTLERRLASVSEADRERVTLDLVRGQVALVLGHDSAEEVDPRRAFKELGFDSLAAVELRNRLNVATGLRLPATLAFDYPTSTAVCGYLLSSVIGEQAKAGSVLSRVGLDEPIAIVGMSCRYPGGVSSPQDLWELLAEGADVTSSFPSDRGWDLERLYDPDPEHPGTSYTCEGGFLDDVGGFDADFFGISPREALAMDPQQRLLLEAAWEALEDAGVDPLSLRGSHTGVYVGISSSDYENGLSELASASLAGYRLTGGASSVASGRVSYTLGLEGPAVSVDTACSSSLVALHLACGALRSGECSLALGGGVTVMSSPAAYVEFSAQRALAPDGRCKSFAAGADGVGWSEGVGMVLLERLSDARRRGHQVLAVVRGSAVNQDGASNGLTAPNGPSQQRVIVQALANARLSAGQVDVVEAHGTGTTLGDPIEAQALLATYGRDRGDRPPLWLGSVKSNIGHSAAAAGVAGVIKMVMAMRHGVLPRTLHVEEPTREVDWSSGAVSLLTEQVPWGCNGEARRAGVSSFGVSGTNAHLILEEAPIESVGSSTVANVELDYRDVEQDELSVGKGGLSVEKPVAVLGDAGADSDGGCEIVVPWVLAGRSEGALRAQAQRVREYLTQVSEICVGDIGVSLAGRSAFEHRAVVVGSRDDLLTGLDAVAAGKPVAGVSRGVSELGGLDRVAFVFPGQGSQWRGMAVELLDQSPAFAKYLSECGEALSLYVDWSVEGVLRGEDSEPGLERIDVVQPALFAVMVALAGLWRTCGVEPAAVVGHSQGEIAAAYVAGGLSLEDAARVVALRSRILAGLSGKGGIVSVALPAAETMRRLERWEGRLELAGVNGPSSVTVSGDDQALAALVEECVAEEVRARLIADTVASHSPRVDEFREELCEALGSITPSRGDVPFYSTVTGRLLDMSELDGEYWFRNMRQPVLFEPATRSLLHDGCRGFIEVSPHPVLTFGIGETADEMLEDTSSVLAVGSLHRESGGVERFLHALGGAWTGGVHVDWARVFAGSEAQRVWLPPYAFQREHFWLTAADRGTGDMASAGQASAGHPMLGAAVTLAKDDGWLFTGRLSSRSQPWLVEHAVMGTALLPATVFLELALHVGGRLECGTVEELTLESPLVLDEHRAVQLQIAVDGLEDSGVRQIGIYSRVEDISDDGQLVENTWTLHASGVLSAGEGVVDRMLAQERAAALADASWPPADAEEVMLDGLYDELLGMGIEYGPAFQGLRGAWRRAGEVFAEVVLSEEQRHDAASFGMHPILLGIALQATGVVTPDGLGVALHGWPGADPSINGTEAEHGLRLPFCWNGVELYAAGASSLRVRLSLLDDSSVSVVMADMDGNLVAAVNSLLSRPLSSESLLSAGGGYRESLFSVEWTPISVDQLVGDGCAEWVVLGKEDSRVFQDIDGGDVKITAHRSLSVYNDALDRHADSPGTVLLDVHDMLADVDGELLTGELDACESGRTPVSAAAADQGAESLGRAVEDGLADRVSDAVCGVLRVMQEWLSDERFKRDRLAIVTRGALSTLPDGGISGLDGSGVWGLVRSAQSENPDRFLLVDLEDRGERNHEDHSWLHTLLSAAVACGESQVAIRDGSLLVGRLKRVKLDHGVVDSRGSEAPASPDARGTVLITGGTGGLGSLLAKHLVCEHGVQSLVLVSRRGSDAPGAMELQQELESFGARVQIVACDVCDPVAVRHLLEQMPSDFPLQGIVHAAGTRANGVISSLVRESVETVLDPKVRGAWNLHHLTKHLDLSMFVLFSSVAGTMGFPGQGNYSAANSFLDALAAYRRSHGLAGTSIAWGYWDQSSEVSDELDEADLARVARQGVLPISPEEGLGLFDSAQAASAAALVAMRLDTATARAQAREGLLPNLMSDLVRVSTRRTADTASLTSRLAVTPVAERESVVLDLVRGEIAIVLGHSFPGAIDPNRAFKDLGFDSLASVELRNRLNTITGLRLPATVAFDHPNTTILTRYLLEQAGSVEQRRPSLPSRSGASGEDLVAIVGMSCRYPGGVRSSQDLWELVSGARDAIGEFPTDRGWDLERLFDPDPDHLGTSYARQGGFVYDIAEFDAGFFGISPREALAMDAQQRLLLEASWEAVESADIDPATLRGSQTGVFTGVTYHDYGAGTQASRRDLEGYIATGVAGSVASGRVAYVFGLEGPAITVDTACSSSLVALHWACHSLRSGESTFALAGGVTVLSSPAPFLEFSRQRGLAVNGRCKAFGAGADGIGFSEGVGVLLLERLSDARRNDHRVLALIRGSAINQDGASNGLTAPNGPSQERVIRQALVNAGLSTTDVDVVEAHGTGTSLGDPIEAQALLTTYGRDRLGRSPLWLGSVKSNIGHTQAASGVAGVIKMVKALEHGMLPRTLHADEPSQHVDWSAGAVSLLTREMPWERNDAPRRAGVSSFGLSGTNAHVILEEPPLHATMAERTGVQEPAALKAEVDAVVPWVVSGRGVGGLSGQAGRLVEFLGSEYGVDGGAGDVGLSLAHRPVFEDRAVVVGSDWDALVGGLRAMAAGDSGLGVLSGRAADGGTAFLFTGQGSQRVGMGRGLYEVFGVFKDAFDEVCAGFDGSLGCSLADVVFGVDGVDDGSGPERLDGTLFAQCALFALEVALFRQVECWGVSPDFLAGHSIGEIVAAHVAGVFSLVDACAVVAARGRLMGSVDANGAMVSVDASEAEVVESLAGFEGRVGIAGVNGPRSVVVSGDEDAVLAVAEGWREREYRTKRLRVSHAFHSPHMDVVLEEFAEILGGLSFGSPSIPIVSNLTGVVVSAEELASVDYWVRHVREPVRWLDGMQWLADRGVSKFLELGPDGVLSGMTRECLDYYLRSGDRVEHERLRIEGEGSPGKGEELGSGSVVCASALRRERPEAESLYSALGELWVRGVGVDWAGVFDGHGFGRVGLPSYAFQRERYWLSGGDGRAEDVRSVGLGSVDHQLLGAVVRLADGEGRVFSGRVSLGDDEWLADHTVMGDVLFPATGFLDLVLSAGREVGCGVLRELVLEAPLVFTGNDRMRLQVTLGEPQQDGARPVGVFSCPETASDVLDEGLVDPERWTRHASGVLSHSDVEHDDLAWQDVFGHVWPPEGSSKIQTGDLYESLMAIGLDYGPVFKGLTAAWRRGDEVFCEVHLPGEYAGHAGSFAVHPALLDSSLHAAGLLNSGGWEIDRANESANVQLPFAWENVRLGVLGASALRVRLSVPPSTDSAEDDAGTLDHASQAGGVLSLVACDETGRLVVSVGSLLTRAVSQEELRVAQGRPSESLFNVRWTPLQPKNGIERERIGAVDWVLLGGDEGPLAKTLRDGGTTVCSYSDLGALVNGTIGSGELAPKVVLVDINGEFADDPNGDEGRPSCEGVIDAARKILCGTLSILQDWFADDRFAESRLVLVSNEAVAVHEEDQLAGLSGSGVWGMVRSVQSEHPERLVLVDVDLRCGGYESRGGPLGALLDTALASGEPQLAIRQGSLSVPRLARVEELDRGLAGGMEHVLRRDGDDIPHELGCDCSVLVTGGTGGLGALVARHLVVEHRVGCVVLASRSGLDAPGARELEAELVELGARVLVIACDVSKRDVVQGLLKQVPAEFPLRGVVHVAGTLADGVIGSLTSESVERVLAPKADAAWHLHELTESMGLCMFVLFSSGAGTMGAPGQSNYAAANAFLDSLAVYRRIRGLAGTSIAWGLWEQAGGMTSGLGEGDMTRLARTGVVGFSVAEGLELFDAAYRTNEPALVAARFDRRMLHANARAGMLPRVLCGLVRIPIESVVAGDSLTQRLAGMSETERESTIFELVRREVATVLGYSSAAMVDPRIAFKDLGFDSLAAVELRNRLNAITGRGLPATLIFDYPTTIVLALHLRDELMGVSREDSVTTEEAAIRRTLASIPLDRLRKAGLLEILLQLSNPDDTTELGVATDSPEAVDAMDVEDLVIAATRGSAGESQ